jgi:hypothetical protein
VEVFHNAFLGNAKVIHRRLRGVAGVLSSPPVNNFGIPIRTPRPQRKSAENHVFLRAQSTNQFNRGMMLVKAMRRKCFATRAVSISPFAMRMLSSLVFNSFILLLTELTG